MIISEMQVKDLDDIIEMELKLFTCPWKYSDYEYELTSNEFAHYYIMKINDQIIGYYGLWTLFEQAQITTIAISNDYQNKGYGKVLMNHLINIAIKKECELLSLEVRFSNMNAIKLYTGYGFEIINIRKNYYQDNNEDAYLMMKAIGGVV